MKLTIEFSTDELEELMNLTESENTDNTIGQYKLEKARENGLLSQNDDTISSLTKEAKNALLERLNELSQRKDNNADNHENRR